MAKFILTGFADEIDADFSVQLQEIKKLDIDYIEIRGVNGKNITDHTIEEVKAIKQQCDDAGVHVSAIGSPIGKINIEDDFEPHFELFKHTIEIAKILETNYIRLFSFFMDTAKAEDYREEVMRRMMAFKDYVEGSDIILLHENEKGIYGDIPERCLDIYETLASDNVKLIFDPANYVQCHIEAYPHAFNVLKDCVIYYHIKDAVEKTSEVVLSGFGDGRIKDIMSALNERGYQGFLSLEPHLGHFEGFDDLEAEGDVPEFKEESDVGKFKLAADTLRKILEEVTHG